VGDALLMSVEYGLRHLPMAALDRRDALLTHIQYFREGKRLRSMLAFTDSDYPKAAFSPEVVLWQYQP
jgi:hypothetical protein